MILLDGKKLSEELKLEIAEEVKQLVAAGKKPGGRLGPRCGEPVGD